MLKRLFCFPWAGGHAAGYEPFKRGLAGFVQVKPVELPGRGQRIDERPFSNFSALIDWLVAELQPELDDSFAFWGHSMGAVISFELARALRRANLPQPSYLFLSAHRAPHLPQPHSTAHLLSDREMTAYLQAWGGSHNNILANQEMMEMVLPILRADLTALNTHVYQEERPLTCPIMALGGIEDKHITRADLTAWEAYTEAPFSVSMFPGGHFYLQTGTAMLLPLLKQAMQKQAQTEGNL